MNMDYSVVSVEEGEIPEPDPNRNIAALVRSPDIPEVCEAWGITDGISHVDDIADLLPGLYKHKEVTPTERGGEWQLHSGLAIPYFLGGEREEPDEFFAVYLGERYETLFSGKLRGGLTGINQAIVESTIDTLTANILEPRGFTRLTSYLTEENGIKLGLAVGLGTSGSVFMASMYVLFSDTARASLMRKMSELETPSVIAVNLAYLVAIVSPFCLSVFLTPKLGEYADRLRTKAVLNGARSFSYGPEAVGDFLYKYETAKNEQRKIRFHNELKEAGLDVPKERSLRIFEAAENAGFSGIKPELDQLEKELAETPGAEQALEKVARIFAAERSA